MASKVWKILYKSHYVHEHGWQGLSKSSCGCLWKHFIWLHAWSVVSYLVVELSPTAETPMGATWPITASISMAFLTSVNTAVWLNTLTKTRKANAASGGLELDVLLWGYRTTHLLLHWYHTLGMTGWLFWVMLLGEGGTLSAATWVSFTASFLTCPCYA